MKLYFLLIIMTNTLSNINSWVITPSAKYYKYAKESELHHGRLAILLIQPHLQIHNSIHNSIHKFHDCINLQDNFNFIQFIIIFEIIIFEIIRLFYLEQPFMMKESHNLGNYLGLNMNNKNVILKTEIFISRIAFIFSFFTFIT